MNWPDIIPGYPGWHASD